MLPCDLPFSFREGTTHSPVLFAAGDSQTIQRTISDFGGKIQMKVKTKLHVVLSLLLCCLMIVGVLPMAVLADDAGNTTPVEDTTTPPAHNKVLTANGDGTYTLSLSVTGSKTTSETESGKADVIVVLDTSGSMAEDESSYEVSKTGRYGYDLWNGYFSLYKKENGQYSKLTSDDFAGTVYQKHNYILGDYYKPYNDTRYIYNATGTRIDVAKSAVNALAENLLNQNISGASEPQIQLSLITFASWAATHTPWTSDLTTFQGYVNAIGTPNGGTNWEDALDKANKLGTRSDADVYVIFVSDGEPTFRNTRIDNEPPKDYNNGVPYYGAGDSDPKGYSYNCALVKAKEITNALNANGQKYKNLYCIGAFGQISKMQQLARESEAGEKNYYSASNQQALLTAFTDIATRITNTLGYKNVVITDTLTKMTETTLKVSSTADDFTYTISGGTYGSAGTPWNGAPTASYKDGVVTWNLAGKELEDGVTYTVSFKVWPSQEAYDLIAALMNNEKTYNELTNDQKDQIIEIKDADGNVIGYGFKTNESATLNYTQYTKTNDTTTDERNGSVNFPTPWIPMNVGKLTVTKVWEDNDNALGLRPASVTVNVLKNNETTPYKVVTLEKNNNWSDIVYVAPNYTYTVEEAFVENYKPTYTSTVEGNSYAPTIALDIPAATFTVTNTLASGSLSIKKEVEGTTDTDKEFQIKVSFTDKNDNPWAPTSNFPTDGIFNLKANGIDTISGIPAGVKYTVTEEKLPNGYSLKTQTENLTGTIKADETTQVVVTNEYSVGSTTAIIPVTKKLTGTQTLPDITNAFTFTLKGKDNAPMPEKGNTVTNPDADGGIASFGAITYTAAGKYTYTITESGYVNFVTNDSEPTKTVTVLVVDNKDGTLTATVQGADYTDGDEIDNNTTFTNTYHKPEGALTITKTFVGAEKITEAQKNSVTFTIKDANGTSVADFNYKDIKDGNNTFKFAPGKYTVSESNVDINSNYTCTTESNTDVPTPSTLSAESDNNPRIVDIVIEDNGTHYVNFINTYELKKATLTITKDFFGAPTDFDTSNVSFTIAGTNYKYSDFSEGKLEITLPLGTYKVAEDTDTADIDGYARTTKYNNVVDDYVEVELTEYGATVAITNTYEKLPDDIITVKIPFTKIVEQGGSIAPSSETFQLEIVDFDKKFNKDSGMSYTAKVTTNGKGSFKEYIVIEGPKDTVESFIKEGFKVREVYTSYANWRYSEDEWIVKAVANGFVFCLKDGNELIPHDKMTFVNTYTNNSNEDHFVIIPEYWSLRLTKVDANDPTYRLAGAQFDLYRVGKTYDTCVGHYTTNSAGEARAAVTRRGEYYWVETQSPAGYTLDTTRHYTHTDTQDRYITVENVKTEAPTVLNSEDHYAYVIGYEDGLVHPEAQITRAETATIFFRLLNEDVRSAYMTKVNSFSDVHEDDWFNTAVSTMASLGMIKGYPDGTFGPNDPITRAEFAAIAARFDPSEVSGVAAFTDIAGHWSEPEVSKAAANGWVNGYTDNSFKPDQNITRAEAMALVNRVLNRNPGSPENLLPDMITWPDNMDLSAWYYLDVQEATNSHTYERQPNNTELWIKINKAPDWTILEK